MNMKFAAIAALGALSLAAIAPQAAAADNGFYIGAGITQTEFDIDDIGEGELDDNSYKIIAGFRPLNWLAVEANYIDLGSMDEDGVEPRHERDHGLGPGSQGIRRHRHFRALGHGELECGRQRRGSRQHRRRRLGTDSLVSVSARISAASAYVPSTSSSRPISSTSWIPTSAPSR